MRKLEVNEKLDLIRQAVGEAVVGYEDVVDLLLTALLSGGHVLLEGPPGIGKTTIAKTFAAAVSGEFKRIQMTPDMLPADVIGVNVYHMEKSSWQLRRGPIFANLVMVDELNRASPKVQSAFLEAMQERQVTIEGDPLELPDPFMVIATQVPSPGAGTYSLTDVQLDRFAYKVDLGYPDRETELGVLSGIDGLEQVKVQPVVDARSVRELMASVKAVYVDPLIQGYILDIVGALRGNRYVRMGPSTRAGIWLLKGARTFALLEGRSFVIPDDVKRIAVSVLAHRLELVSQARADGVSGVQLVDEALGSVVVPKVPARD